MRIGVPTEIKPMEQRVALTPDAVGELVHRGHEVYVQQGAGRASGYPDEAYHRLGAGLVDSAAALYGAAELIIKVKEPVAEEYEHLSAGHTLFCFLHLAANPELSEHLQHTGLTAIAFETVTEGRQLPLLAPMSQIAGRVSVQAASHWLHGAQGGRGVLLGGIPGAERGRVVVLGAGTAGTQAAAMAAGMGAEVLVFDKSPEALGRAFELGANCTARYPVRTDIEAALAEAELVVGAVLVPGGRAPTLVTEAMVAGMRAGSVIVDISIDQGGCVETMRATDYRNPVFEHQGVLHMGVTNLPGAVPRTASQALAGALLPYAVALADGRLRDWPGLADGVNIRDGHVVHPALNA